MNGWVTDQRMRGIITTPLRGCLLGCHNASDRIEHYAVCPVFWRFAASPRPAGLGLPPAARSLCHFLLVAKGTNDADIVRMAAGSYAIARVLGLLRRCETTAVVDVIPLLRLYAYRAVEGSSAAHHLR